MAEMISKADFLNKVKNDINFSFQEKRRKSLLTKIIANTITTCVLLLCGIGYIAYNIISKADSASLPLVVLLMVIVLLISFLNGVPLNEFKTTLKKNFNEKVLTCLGLKRILEFDFNQDIKKSYLFPNFTNAEFDDVIGNDDFVAMEAKLIHTEEFQGRYGKTKVNTIVYKGLILLLKCNKQIKAKTIVATKHDNNIFNYINSKGVFKGALYIWLLLFFYMGAVFFNFIKYSNFGTLLSLIFAILYAICWTFYKIINSIINHIENKKILKKLNLEDIMFDKNFKVYSENQIEGRYLVTPTFMERFQNLQTAFGTKYVKCSFYDDKIMFTISTNKDLFEIGTLYVPFGKDLEKLYDEIESIYEIIDYFKLNERTGL